MTPPPADRGASARPPREPTPRPTEVPPRALPVLSDDEVPDFLESSGVAVLAFVAAGDPVCERLLSKLAHVMGRLGGAAAAGVVDLGRDGLVAEAMGVKEVPLVVVFVEGALVDRLIGSPPEPILEETIRARLPR